MNPPSDIKQSSQSQILIVVESLSERSYRWFQDNHQENWCVICLKGGGELLSESTISYEVVDLAPYLQEFTKQALELLEADLEHIKPLADVFSRILELDASTCLQRYLLNVYYIRRAQVEHLRALYGLNHEAIYIAGHLIIFDGFLNILSLRRRLAKYKHLVGFSVQAIKSLRHLAKSHGDPVDLLLFVSHLSITQLSQVLNMLEYAGVSHATVDVAYRSILQEPVHKCRYFAGKFYRYYFNTLFTYLRFLLLSFPSTVFFADYMADALIVRYRAQAAYDQFRCSVVFCQGEHTPYQSIEVHQFRKNGCEVVDFVHGEKMYIPRDALVEYDNLLVWGEYYRNLFERLRYRGTRITVTGNPAFDVIDGYQASDAKLLEIRRTYSRIISVCTQPTYGFASVEWQTQMMEDVCSYVKDKPDIFVFVKHHPSDFLFPMPDHDKIIGGLHNVQRCRHGEYALYDLIAVSDLVITPYSTVGMEAILFRKNVLYANYGDVPHLVPYTLEGSAVEIRDSDEFQDHVDSLLEGDVKLAHQETIDLHANGLDGNSAQYIYDEILKSLKATAKVSRFR